MMMRMTAQEVVEGGKAAAEVVVGGGGGGGLLGGGAVKVCCGWRSPVDDKRDLETSESLHVFGLSWRSSNAKVPHRALLKNGSNFKIACERNQLSFSNCARAIIIAAATFYSHLRGLI